MSSFSQNKGENVFLDKVVMGNKRFREKKLHECLRTLQMARSSDVNDTFQLRSNLLIQS